MPNQPPQQLDIFADSQETALRNDVLLALAQRHAPAAQAAWQRLQQACPADEHLAPQAVLVAALAAALSAVETLPFTGHDALSAARARLQDETTPAAQRLFGPAAATWLAPLWRALARRAAALPYQAERGDDHAPPLWLAAGDWPAAQQAAEVIDAWRQRPAPLAWVTEACWRSRGLDAAWPLLAALAWQAPARVDAVARRVADPSFNRLRKAFDARFDGQHGALDLAWLPAWVLTDKPGLAGLLDVTPRALGSPPEQAMRLMCTLLRLERQGRRAELIDGRQALRNLHAALYAAYLASR